MAAHRSEALGRVKSGKEENQPNDVSLNGSPLGVTGPGPTKEPLRSRGRFHLRMEVEHYCQVLLPLVKDCSKRR